MSPSSASLELAEWWGKGKNGVGRDVSGEGRRSRERKLGEERERGYKRAGREEEK